MSLLMDYNIDDIIIGTVCSHSALQIFHGARLEGFRTIGLTLPQRKTLYEAFPLAGPDTLLEISSWDEVTNQEVEDQLIHGNVIIIPHGSFVEYVGVNKILHTFRVPVFGNKASLEWESSRKKVDTWMRTAGLRVPDYKQPDEIDSLCIVKMGGAKGGKGFFLIHNEAELYEGLGGKDPNTVVIQEYIVGVRYYFHYFHSLARNRVEFLGIDQRLESNVDGLHRIKERIEPTYTVTGNAPVVIRESLLPEIIEMGEKVVASSKQLFPPGISGPFCIETICTPELEFFAFEISARIVAGTNLYPNGSQYSCYYFTEPMSTGRRISREINEARDKGILEEVVS
ncbi:MAG: formate--phosphoribosylaminoimidazolecarboxamide ligase [Candidatus Thorarchaeota archaeon]